MTASEVQPREPGAQSKAFRTAGEPCSLGWAEVGGGQSVRVGAVLVRLG